MSLGLKTPNKGSSMRVARKYLIDKEAVCSECETEYSPVKKSDMGVDAWAKKHALETGHIVTIQECHDVAVFEEEI